MSSVCSITLTLRAEGKYARTHVVIVVLALRLPSAAEKTARNRASRDSSFNQTALQWACLSPPPSSFPPSLPLILSRFLSHSPSPSRLPHPRRQWRPGTGIHIHGAWTHARHVIQGTCVNRIRHNTTQLTDEASRAMASGIFRWRAIPPGDKNKWGRPADLSIIQTA
jgi:hypothetical protein